MELGIRIFSMDGGFTYGYNRRVRENICEIDIKETGQMGSEKDLAHFIMQMDQNTKDIGRII